MPKSQRAGDSNRRGKPKKRVTAWVVFDPAAGGVQPHTMRWKRTDAIRNYAGNRAVWGMLRRRYGCRCVKMEITIIVE